MSCGHEVLPLNSQRVGQVHDEVQEASHTGGQVRPVKECAVQEALHDGRDGKCSEEHDDNTRIRVLQDPASL